MPCAVSLMGVARRRIRESTAARRTDLSSLAAKKTAEGRGGGRVCGGG